MKNVVDFPHFSRVSATYLREIADFTGYYKEALRYLGCVDIEKMTEEERIQHALCLALAALLGENVYNFGELVGFFVENHRMCVKGYGDSLTRYGEVVRGEVATTVSRLVLVVEPAKITQKNIHTLKEEPTQAPALQVYEPYG